MTEETKQNDPLDELIHSNGFDKDRFEQALNENFTTEEIAKLTGILGLYEPLLSRSLVMNKALLSMEAKNFIELDAEHKKCINNWIDDYNGLNETIKALNNGENFH